MVRLFGHGILGKKISTCCDDGKLVKKYTRDECYPIMTPKNDSIYAGTGVECSVFTRTLTDKDRTHCGSRPNAPAEQINVVSGFLDLSLVYGNNRKQNNPIRAFGGGRL